MRNLYKRLSFIFLTITLFTFLFGGVANATEYKKVDAELKKVNLNQLKFHKVEPNKLNIQATYPVSLQAYNGWAKNGGNIVSAEPNGNVVANRGWIREWEVLYLIPLSNGYWAIQANSNGKYIAAEPNGKVVANRDSIKEWEQYEVLATSDWSYIQLRARSNGKWIAAEGGGGRELVANRDQAREWETFRAYWH